MSNPCGVMLTFSCEIENLIDTQELANLYPGLSQEAALLQYVQDEIRPEKDTRYPGSALDEMVHDGTRFKLVSVEPLQIYPLPPPNDGKS